MASTVLPNGTIIPEKFSRDWYADLYHNWQELDNLLGGGTPKDGTLTIQKNGTTVGTFSANQATDETINIEVPTATSELTNDSNFVQSSDLATVATSGSYTDLSDKPTIPTVNNATLTIQQNGTTVDSFSANSSSDKTVNIQCVDLANNQTVGGNKEFTGTTTAHDLVPSATDTYNFGSSSYQWNNAYIKSLTINGVACGDILTRNASEFVDVSTAQTISGDKTFIGRLTYKSTSTIAGDSTSGNFAGSFNFIDKNNVQLGTLGLGVYNNNGYTEQTLNIINPLWFNDNTKTKNFAVRLRVTHNTGEASFTPTNNAINLGGTTQKWKTFNGLNPGALSLPNNTSYINVDTTNWDLTCQNGLLGSFTPTADGWLMLHIANSGTSEVNFWVIGGVTRINNKSSINTVNNDNFNMLIIPVEKNVTYSIYGNASEYVAGRSIAYCRFVRCQGNV